MKKRARRDRIGRRDILRGMARSLVRIQDLKKAGGYSKQDYDGHSFEELQQRPGSGRGAAAT